MTSAFIGIARGALTVRQPPRPARVTDTHLLGAIPRLVKYFLSVVRASSLIAHDSQADEWQSLPIFSDLIEVAKLIARELLEAQREHDHDETECGVATGRQYIIRLPFTHIKIL